jgi:protein-S-isoprenylcysteine O-methyltransferase Ste14
MSRNWPVLIIGLVVAIYWFRVVLMVRRAPRVSAGHGANLLPPERLGRVLRIVWIPVIVLWIALPLLTFFARPSDRHLEGVRAALVARSAAPPWLGWAAAVAALLCLLATIVCWNRMGSSWRMGIDPNDKTRLVFGGPYAFVRHPIYGLSSLMMLATMAAVPSALMIAAGVVHVLLLQWEARREEQYLIAVHGDEYRRYALHTGRFFPRSLRAYAGARV